MEEIFNQSSVANAASIVGASNGPVMLDGFSGYNAKTATQFIQVHDAASLPANGAIPKLMFPVAASSPFQMEWINGRKFTTGIVICNSSTQQTLTIGSADCWFDVQMRTFNG